MTSSRSASRSITISGIIALAGVASSSLAGGPFNKGDLVSTRKAGVMYINLGTGERTLTRYDAEIVPEIDAARSSAALFDYWMSIDENPCWDDPRESGFGFLADATTDVSLGITTSAVSWDFGDTPFDSKISGILVSTAVMHLESVDTNGDGLLDSGLDTVLVYYDALSEGNRTSIAPPTAVVRVESIPGNKPGSSSPFVLDDFEIIVDFGAGNHFELGDSDGLSRGNMWLSGAAAGLDVEATSTLVDGRKFVDITDGLADFQYLQYYVMHGGDDKVTSNSTFVMFGVPTGGTTVFETSYVTQVYCTTSSGTGTTCTETVVLQITFLTPDPLPAGQGAFESIGFGSLVASGDVGGVQAWPEVSAGCCFWFGGIDCAGFLNNLVEDPPNNETWFMFSPFAQFAAGLFSDAPSGTACDAIDFNNDGFIESGDISQFITLFLSSAPPADLNNDGFIDNGDIAVFIEFFLGCAQ